MGSMVSVDVEDHRQEDFKRKVKKVQTFKGSGHTLGRCVEKVNSLRPKNNLLPYSPAPNIIDASVQDCTPQPNNEENERQAVERLSVNPSEGVTQLQIRLADGSRITNQFNLTHTVGDVRRFIET